MSKSSRIPYGHNVNTMPPCKVFTCTELKELKALSTEYGVDISVLPGAIAQASWIDSDGDSFGVVYVPASMKVNYSRAQTDAMITHEAVHIALDYFNDIGEDEPGDEQIAYAIQYITQHILNVFYGKEIGHENR